jgi:hypothetical protein
MVLNNFLKIRDIFLNCFSMFLDVTFDIETEVVLRQFFRFLLKFWALLRKFLKILTVVSGFWRSLDIRVG